MTAERASGSRPLSTTDEIVRGHDAQVWERQEAYIAETLAWCAELFGTTRARFIRPIDGERWMVYTRQRDSLVTHMADHAETAMAYTVGLSRQPLAATRPRISKADGSGLRPIALTTYLGIPVLCQDRLVGVIEFAGDVRPDIDAAIAAALPRLRTVGERLLFDPLLNARLEIAAESFCELDALVWSADTIALTPEELGFLACLIGPMTITDIAAACDLTLPRALEMARDLTTRGLLAVRAE